MIEQVRDRCPVCGYLFDEIEEYNFCPVCGGESKQDELIGDDDYYAWCI